jgi:hypothetical protein
MLLIYKRYKIWRVRRHITKAYKDTGIWCSRFNWLLCSREDRNGITQAAEAYADAYDILAERNPLAITETYADYNSWKQRYS